MCIFHEKKKNVRHSTLEIIEDETIHYYPRVSINTIAPIIDTFDNNNENNSGSENSNYNQSDNYTNTKNSSSDISDTIDKDAIISLNELTKRTSFDDIYNAKNLKPNINEKHIIEKIIKKSINRHIKRISIDKFENIKPIIHKVILNKPEISILELYYQNQNNKLPWCHNIKIENNFY